MKCMIYKSVKLGLAWLLLCNLFGCGATELEERCFPMVVAVGYEDNGQGVTYEIGFPRVGTSGEKEPLINEIQVPQVFQESFEKSKEEYEKHLNKEADYNHLKVLVLEESFIEHKTMYNEMLDVLAKTEDFPRNTYICVVDNIGELMKIEENLPQDLGTYLEEYLNNHEEKKQHIVTLGDLLDEKENKELELMIPFLEVKETYVEWMKNYILSE